METIPDYQSILDAVDRRDLIDTLHAAGEGRASDDEDNRVVLELLHRKRFIDLELSQPRFPKAGMPEISIIGATLTAQGGQFLDWLEPKSLNGEQHMTID